MSDDQQAPATAESALAPLLDKMDQLMGRIDRLVTALEAGAVPVSPTAVRPETGSAEAELSAVEPAPVAAETPPAPPELSVLPSLTLGDGEWPETPLDDLGNPLPGPWTSVEEVLVEVFRAALHSDEEEAFLHFQRLMHTECVRAPQALTHLRVFQWKQLRNRAPQYLARAGDPTSFQVMHRRPENESDADGVWKIFVKSSVREPVPTLFRRDPSVGGNWRIDTSSL